MRQESPPLRAFIKHYGLEKPNGVICFTAGINFHSKKKKFRFSSSVHIITLTNKHLDVIYLLSPKINARQINTMYSNNQKFNYTNTKHFYIKGISRRYGHYTLFINPVSTNCEADTLAELNAKLSN